MLKRLSFRKFVTLRKACPTSRVNSNVPNYSTVSDDDDRQASEDPLKCKTKNVAELLQQAATFSETANKDWMTTPYVQGIPTPRKDDGKPPGVDPESRFVLLFPGQGIIKVGMVQKYMNYSSAKELFDIAKEITNFDILKLCLKGPQEKLNRTEYNQVATVVSSLAALEKIREQNKTVFDNCVATAGYSVGEITALILSGVLSYEDGVRLAWVRGKAMQFASSKEPQGMISVTCTREAKVSKACSEAQAWARDKGVENPVCRIAIFLCTERKILAGSQEALDFIEKHAGEYGLSNVTKLPVSGAFHTPLMEPALKPVFELLSSIEVNEPRCQVYSNYKAQPYINLKYAKKYILKQIVSPVRWEQCVQNIYSRPVGTAFPQTYDVGSEGRMKAILKLINAKACRSCNVV